MRSSGRAGFGLFSLILWLLLVVVVAGAGVWGFNRYFAPVQFDTPYQAVLLTNGQVFYGRLSGYGTRHPWLREIYYVKSTVDPQTKEPNNTLLKRGNEWHGPDKMTLNPDHIVLVEPVSPNSRVATLIVELRNR